MQLFITKLTERVCCFIGGTNLGELDLFWMRRKIALVSQEPVLFATTIAGNIAYGREATQEEVSHAVFD